MQRTVLISGAGRGIGRAIAERLIADGHRVSLGLRDPTVFGGTDAAGSDDECCVCDEIDPERTVPNRTDVEGVVPPRLSLATGLVYRHRYEARDPSSARDWVAATVEHWGGFDALIHCAGILRSTPLLFEEGEEQDLEDLWQVNVMGPWWLTRAAWPQLILSGKSRIQVLVSMSGKRVKGRMAGYPVSKFALMGLCQSMRNEGWEHGLRVTAICPSWVNTEMARSATSMIDDAMTQPEDLSALCSTLLQLPNQSVPFEVALNCSLEI
jgi:NAD(P)-dependent dehydrogenase (short-subunit alcohol dehydrogenase family)